MDTLTEPTEKAPEMRQLQERNADVIEQRKQSLRDGAP